MSEGERAELETFKKMGETRAVAMNDELGKFVKVKWVRINKGSRGAVSSGCTGAGVRSADGRVVRCNSFIAGKN